MIKFHNNNISAIYFPEEQQNKLLEHCLRKLNCIYIPNETKERKAYGMIGGKIEQDIFKIELVAPLYKNSRSQGATKEYMDEVLEKFAIPSETPLEKRAWVADPVETKNIINKCDKDQIHLAGTYHMHRVAWESDKKRETPTELDTILGKDTEMFMFIISVVNPEKPVVRAFYEGYPDQEVPLIW